MCGTPARDRNSSTRRDLPTRRRPRINSALPGLPPTSLTRDSRPFSTFSCWSRPINTDTVTLRLTPSSLVLPTLRVSPLIVSTGLQACRQPRSGPLSLHLPSVESVRLAQQLWDSRTLLAFHARRRPPTAV